MNKDARTHGKVTPKNVNVAVKTLSLKLHGKNYVTGNPAMKSGFA